MTTCFRRIASNVALLVILSSLLGACASGGVSTPTSVPIIRPTQIPTATPIPPLFPKTVDLQHELTINRGLAVTSQEQCPQALQGMERGVILGMDPHTCEVSTDFSYSQGVDASLDLLIPPEYVNNVITVRIAWPDDGRRGLRSSTFAEAAFIEVNGQMVWKKATLTAQADALYYAARSEPILLTFVPRESRTYSIHIHVPVTMAWDIGSMEILASPYPKNTMGIAYSPYFQCQEPGTEDQPWVYSVWDEIAGLAHSATAIRTYSSTGVNGSIPEGAAVVGIPVYAGAWLDNSPTDLHLDADNLEMEGIFRIAADDPIEAAIIGNEYHLRHITEPGDLDYLASRINEFKSAFPHIPVATAEIESLAFNWSSDGNVVINPEYKPILDQIDILLVHIYPFWSYLPVDGAAQYTIDHYLKMKSVLDAQYGGTKRLIIGEAGWPSQGGPGDNGGGSGAGQATDKTQTTSVFHPEAQRQYMIELLTLAQQNQVDLFYFDAFDELWKTEGENGAGRSWGLSYADRSAKYNVSSLLVPAENMPSSKQGDIFNPFTESDFNWGLGSYPIYTDWPHEPKGKPQDLSEFQPYSMAMMGNPAQLEIYPCDHRTHSGETSLRVSYFPGRAFSDPYSSDLNWAGAYWLYPQQNWGTYAEAQDISAAQSVTFWARGSRGGEVVEFLAGGICEEYDGKKIPLCPDSIQPRISTGPIILTEQWQKYTLDLGTADRSNIVGAFGFSISSLYNPSEMAFYLDDIAFSPERPMPGTNVYPKPMGPIFNIYTDYTALNNHYVPSNFMGDAVYGDRFQFVADWAEAPHSGDTAIKIKYEQPGTNGWAGVYWTDPDKNWGQRPGGYDLTGVTRLTFWAKSDSPNKQLKILIGGMGCAQSYLPYRDSVCNAVPVPLIDLTTEWQQYTIDLTKVERDWSQLLGGFGFVVVQSGTFYLDDISYHFGN